MSNKKETAFEEFCRTNFGARCFRKGFQSGRKQALEEVLKNLEECRVSEGQLFAFRKHREWLEAQISANALPEQRVKAKLKEAKK